MVAKVLIQALNDGATQTKLEVQLWDDKQHEMVAGKQIATDGEGLGHFDVPADHWLVIKPIGAPVPAPAPQPAAAVDPVAAEKSQLEARLAELNALQVGGANV